MSFWQKTVDTAKDVFEVAAKKTEQTVEIQKLRIAVAKQKNKVNKAFETLGRSYYEGREGEESSAALLETLCRDQAEELEKLSQLKQELQKAIAKRKE